MLIQRTFIEWLVVIVVRTQNIIDPLENDGGECLHEDGDIKMEILAFCSFSFLSLQSLKSFLEGVNWNPIRLVSVHSMQIFGGLLVWLYIEIEHCQSIAIWSFKR